MKKLSPAQAQLLDELKRLAEAFPRYAARLEECHDDLRWQMERTPRRDRQLILDGIRLGCHSAADLVDETGLDLNGVRTTLGKLLAEGVIEERLEGRPQATRGNQMTLYFLRGEPAGSDLQLRTPARQSNYDARSVRGFN